MHFGINTKHIFILFLLCFLLIQLVPSKSYGQLVISDVEVLWEDSLIVVRPEIQKPFTDQTLETLRSGINIAIDVEIQFIRTGYVKREYSRVPVQYNVFTDKYRVTTPIGPLAVNDYETVQTLFRNDIIFIVPEKDLPKKGNWFVKVRAGERILMGEDSDSESVSRIEDELSGIAGWFFKKGKKKDNYCDWSHLTPLPEKPE